MLWLAAVKLQASPDLVVTGKSLIEAHERCRRGHCFPDRDMQVTISYGEALLRTGDYLSAKNVLASAAHRNRNHAAAFPRNLASLQNAYGTVALLEGDREAYRTAIGSRVHILRSHLPEDDPARLEAEVA